MKLLALDAATEACSVAIKTPNEVFEYFEECPQQHSQKLLPAVETLLSQAKLSLSELDGIVYGCGPGSFTGVRIGVSITQGLAFGADLKVVGVSNLAMMAQEAITQHDAKYVVTAIDARMSEVYFAIYKNSNGMAEPVIKDVVCKPDNIGKILSSLSEDELQDINENSYAAGTGWETYKSELQEHIPAQLTDIRLPNVKFVFGIAEQLFAKGEATVAEMAQPNYVRDEVTWKKLPGR